MTQSLASLERQLRSTEQLASVTRTMQTLSAVYVRQFEQAAVAVRRYDQTLELGLHVVLRDRPAEVPRTTSSARTRTAIIVVGSDYGLCGPFNEVIARYAAEGFDRLGVEPAERVVAAVGQRTPGPLRRNGLAPVAELPGPTSAAGIEGTVRQLLSTVDDWNESGEFRRVLISHHAHRGAGGARFRTQQLLPVEFSRFRRLGERPWPSRRIPTYSMDREALLSALLRQLFSISLFRALAESSASEHASRLQSMRAAGKSIDEKRDALRTRFHRCRQDAVTAELLEIVSGYEALVSSRRA